MPACAECDKDIVWPRKPVYPDNCAVHCYHKKCMRFDHCFVCLEMDIQSFLCQTTEADMKKKYKPRFDIKILLGRASKKCTIKFLLKKANVHKLLVECVLENNRTLFEKILNASTLDMFSTYNGLTIRENITTEPYRSMIDKHINRTMRRPPPPPPRPPTPPRPPRPQTFLYPVLVPTAPPPSYEDAIREL